MKAALSLCVRLRQELDDTRSRLRLAEHDLTKYRPTYSSSSENLFLDLSQYV